MKKLLILLVALVSFGIFVNKAEAKWWIFGQGNDETGFDYLYLNNNSYDEIGNKVVLYKDSLPNGMIIISGKTSIKKGKVGYVKISKDNKQSWAKAKVSDNGAFTYSFIPDTDNKYQFYIEVSDTMGITNKVDETYKEVTVVNENIKAKVAETINNLIRAYENEEENLFMTYISSDFAGDYAVLDSAIRKDFNAFDAIKINPFINNITSGSDGKIYVALQFNRTVISTKSGQTYTDKGYTEFILTNEDGKFKVHSMKNPLIFGLSAAGEVATGTVQATNNDPIILVDNTGNVNEQPFRTAINIIENDSDINSNSSSESVETGTVTIYTPQSFEFATEITAPHVMHLDISYDYPNVFVGLGGGNYIDLGASTLSSITSVPVSTDPAYTGAPFMPTVGHCYAILVGSAPYKYAVVRATNTPTMVNNFWTIEYKYQPSGSNNF